MADSPDKNPTHAFAGLQRRTATSSMRRNETAEAVSPLRSADERARPVIAKMLRSYVALYRRRAEKGDGRAFSAPEPNALAVLVLGRAATVRPRDFDGNQTVRVMHDLTRTLLADAHSPAADITGIAWADAYGVLPLERPPLETLDAIVVSGARPGAVGGLYGAVWRGLFLASAMPLLNSRIRPLALEQLYRWTHYIGPRLSEIAGNSPVASAADLSQRARIAAAAGELAQRLGDAALMRAAAELIKPVISGPHDDRIPMGDNAPLASGHAAQICLAAATVAEHGFANDVLGALLEHRLDPRRWLLRATDADDDRVDSSPWVPLTVLSVLGDSQAELQLTGSRLRRVLTGARRRAS